jgi:hypothetical protein
MQAMGLLSWLFGASGNRWALSENGNPTLVVDDHRLTVFPQDDGYKFCAARADRDDRDPYFSDVYQSEEQAKDCAIAYLDGRPSPHVSLTENWREQRTIRARQHLDDTAARFSDVVRDAFDAVTVTDLRKVERKAVSTIKSLSLAVDRALHDGLSDNDVARAEALKAQAKRLLAAVQKRSQASRYASRHCPASQLMVGCSPQRGEDHA